MGRGGGFIYEIKIDHKIGGSPYDKDHRPQNNRIPLDEGPQ